MRRHVRKMSIRIKILVPVAILIVAICVLLGLSAYQNTHGNMVQMGVEQANIAADIALTMTDGDLVAQITKGTEGTEAYDTLLQNMRKIQGNCGIEFLYTLYATDGIVYYGVDTDTSEDQAMPGEKFEVSYEELEDVFNGQEYVQDYIDSTVDGELISVYKPIYNSSGNIVGVLGSDYNAEMVVEKLNKVLISNLLLTSVCLIVSIILLMIIVIVSVK